MQSDHLSSEVEDVLRVTFTDMAAVISQASVRLKSIIRSAANETSLPEGYIVSRWNNQSITQIGEQEGSEAGKEYMNIESSPSMSLVLYCNMDGANG